MSKAESRRFQSRQIRRILNRNLETFKSVSGRFLGKIKYGQGLSDRNIQEYDQKDPLEDGDPMDILAEEEKRLDLD